jgi:outer membrane lipoprotein-sorting protein
MLKYIIFFFIITFINSSAIASNKDKIIQKLNSIQNFNFNFKQVIDDHSENGNCTVQYPKKIFCEYQNVNKKIIVSDGKTLVIKNRNSGTYYRYPLKKTPLEYILDKNYLINKIQNLEERIIENKYVNFEIIEKNNKINIFFDINSLYLVGWQTEDVYQKLSITFISLLNINKDINNNFFQLPNIN